MNIILVQLVLLCFSFFMIYRLFLHWKKREIGSCFFIVWFFMWMMLIIITVFPTIFENLLFKPFFVRLLDFGTICAFIVLTYLTLENNIKIKKCETEIEKIVRELAIKNKISIKKENK